MFMSYLTFYLMNTEVPGVRPQTVKHDENSGGIVILDLGSQYTQLLARRIRELEVYSEILPWNADMREIMKKNPRGVILSGGSRSTTGPDATNIDESMPRGKIPVLDIRYGMEADATEQGREILSNFLFGACGCEPNWKLDDWVNRSLKSIKETVGPDEQVICGISGGVDSTVSATLVSKVIGDRLGCIFVDHGFMRKDEPRQVADAYRELNLRVTHVDASERFLEAIKGVTNPEKKRKIIGELFVRVFEEEARKFGGAKWLLQGTIYPDVIESGQAGGDVIKSHHNVGGLPEDMEMSLLEPIRELLKDEVRRIGPLLGIPEDLLKRHPFPGPGLAVRCLGEITRERLDTLRDADSIFISEIKDAGLYDEIWQAFCVLLPVRSVGMAGDARTYDETVVLRAVASRDAMTAESVCLPWGLVDKVTKRICSEVPKVGRVVMDVTGKPPGTIEWE